MDPAASVKDVEAEDKGGRGETSLGQDGGVGFVFETNGHLGRNGTVKERLRESEEVEEEEERRDVGVDAVLSRGDGGRAKLGSADKAGRQEWPSTDESPASVDDGQKAPRVELEPQPGRVGASFAVHGLLLALGIWFSWVLFASSWSATPPEDDQHVDVPGSCSLDGYVELSHIYKDV